MHSIKLGRDDHVLTAFLPAGASSLALWTILIKVPTSSALHLPAWCKNMARRSSHNTKTHGQDTWSLWYKHLMEHSWPPLLTLDTINVCQVNVPSAPQCIGVPSHDLPHELPLVAMLSHQLCQLGILLRSELARLQGRAMDVRETVPKDPAD